MYTVFLAGGIASGKSTLARLLTDMGAVRIDLDDCSREVLAADSPLLDAIAQTFGADLVDAGGNLNRDLLARRAFATEEETRKLEALELPALLQALRTRLASIEAQSAEAVCVVEIPRLDTMGDMLRCADEIDIVVAPLEKRLARAGGKGLAPQDFMQRAALQPSNEELVSLASSVCPHASYVIQNAGSSLDLEAAAVSIFNRAKDTENA